MRVPSYKYLVISDLFKYNVPLDVGILGTGSESDRSNTGHIAIIEGRTTNSTETTLY